MTNGTPPEGMVAVDTTGAAVVATIDDGKVNALSAALIFFNIAVGRLYKDKRYRAVGRLDLIARVLYPAVGLITVVAYVARFRV